MIKRFRGVKFCAYNPALDGWWLLLPKYSVVTFYDPLTGLMYKGCRENLKVHTFRVLALELQVMFEEENDGTHL